ncbi:unnamed protein product, partial [Meganyctiphanes norvegica]
MWKLVAPRIDLVVGIAWSLNDNVSRRLFVRKKLLYDNSKVLVMIEEEAGCGDKLSTDEKQRITQKVDQTLAWIDSNHLAEKEEFEDMMRQLEAEWRPLASKVHGGMPQEGGQGQGPTVEEVD